MTIGRWDNKLLSWSISCVQPKETAMSDEKQVVRTWLEDGLGCGSLTALAESMSPDVVFHGGPVGETHGVDELIAVVADYRIAFPDLTVTVHDQIADGDRVATRFGVQGNNLGDLAGFPPTGNRVAVEVINIARVEDGQIVEIWSETDTFDLLEQLLAD